MSFAFGQFVRSGLGAGLNEGQSVLLYTVLTLVFLIPGLFVLTRQAAKDEEDRDNGQLVVALFMTFAGVAVLAVSAVGMTWQDF
jgi:hypothetical protein